MSKCYSGSFRVRDNTVGVRCIDYFTERVSTTTGEGAGSIEGIPTFRTRDGTPVTRRAKGVYIYLDPLGRETVLRTDDPSAP
jgi:hypothetical protein